jgi:hypothetical protein
VLYIALPPIVAVANSHEWSSPMSKLVSVLVAASLATLSFSTFAGSHGGAMKEKMEACKKMDEKTADEKMKAECKAMMEKK